MRAEMAWPEPANRRKHFKVHVLSGTCTCNNAPLPTIMPTDYASMHYTLLRAISFSISIMHSRGCLASGHSYADVPPAILFDFRVRVFHPNAQGCRRQPVQLKSLTPITLLCFKQSPLHKLSLESSNNKPTTQGTTYRKEKKQFASSNQSFSAVDLLQNCQLEQLSSHLNTEDRSSICQQLESNAALTSKSSSSSNSNMLPSLSPSMSLLVPVCVALSSTRRVRR
jgi:hypothetical protein